MACALMSPFLFSHPSILHARRHNSQQVCRHRITGQQLSEHPAADTGTRPRVHSARVANLFLSTYLLILCFVSRLWGCFLLCHVPVASVAVVRFLHFNFLHQPAPLSFSPSLEFSYLCQTTPTCVQVTSAPQHLETISNCPIGPPSPFLLLFLHLLHPLFIPPVLQPYFVSVFLLNSVSLPLALTLPLVHTCVAITLHPFVITGICLHFFHSGTLLFNPREMKVSLGIKV